MPGCRCLRFALLVLPLAGCGRAGAGTDAVLTDSAGVVIAVSPGADRPLPWTLTEVARWGGADTGALSFSRVAPELVVVDELGRIVVLDPQAHRVVVLDTLGRVVHQVGRQGGGPGEFQFPVVLTARSGGGWEVLDLGKGARVGFGPDGGVGPERALDRERHPDGGVYHQPSAEVYRALEVGNTGSTYRIVRDTTTLLTLTAPGKGFVDFGCVGLNIPPIFSPRPQFAVSGDRLAVSRQTHYLIDVYDGPRLARSVRRDIPPVPSSREALARLYPDGFRVRFSRPGECIITLDDLETKLGMAPVVPALRALALAPDGALWVERYTFEDEGPRVDVFSAEGGYLGTLTGRGLPLGFVGNLVLFGEEDEATGLHYLVAVRVERSQ